MGWDTHQLIPGRPLILGGVHLQDAELGLDGHSDADVLTHAIIDAMLGAAGLGDIGDHFPDTDAAFAGADSLVLLRETAALLRAEGLVVAHIDATIILERPKLADRKPLMRERLAEALGLSATHVNVKATRGEGMGPVGRGEGAVAMAIATVIERTA